MKTMHTLTKQDLYELADKFFEDVPNSCSVGTVLTISNYDAKQRKDVVINQVIVLDKICEEFK